MASKKEPPFFNEDNVGSLYCKLPYCETMELFIETLAGTCFELQVSPVETVVSVKAKIQRLEGIPVSQQHLIWNNIELEDDCCLNDYNIAEGCTLKLILAMRGGPINTRRVPVEDPIREITEYMDPSYDDVWEKGPCNKQIAFLILREGDQVNFFRVIDRGDGTITPLSESLSGGSIYNLYPEDDEDAEASPSGQQIIENSITMNKMKLLKAKMESMNLNKKPKKLIKVFPHPPLAPRPASGSMAAARHRFFQALPQIGQSCLPTPGNSFPSELPPKALSVLGVAGRRAPTIDSDLSKGNDKREASSQPQSFGTPQPRPKTLHKEKEAAKFPADNIMLIQTLLTGSEKSAENGRAENERGHVLCPVLNHMDVHATEEKPNSTPNRDAVALTEPSPAEPRSELFAGKVNPELIRTSSGDENCNTAGLLGKPNTEPLTSGTAKAFIPTFHELSSPKNTCLSSLQRSAQVTHCSPQKPPLSSRSFEAGNFRSAAPPNVLRSLEVHSFSDSSYTRSPRYHSNRMDSPGKRPDIHSKMEARELADVSIKVSKEPIVSVNNVGFLTSLAQRTNREGLQNSCGTSRFRTSGIALSTNFQHFQDESFRMASPHNDMPGYFLSPGLGLNGTIMAMGKRIAGDASHLPPVNGSVQTKKKIAKHCCFCGKKTGLATSYECRRLNQDFMKPCGSLMALEGFPEWMWKQLLCNSPLCRDSLLYVRLQERRAKILAGIKSRGQRSQTSQNLILVVRHASRILQLPGPFSLGCAFSVRFAKLPMRAGYM
ncbi:AN1-type zinc finger protein 4 isoform X3 [Paroedura picta]|uniref:AN1-type zinc finger protein 4 isoform X3 n=1 Tax=Paroedura picta TaxID=143630 RepID=UPI0040575091